MLNIIFLVFANLLFGNSWFDYTPKKEAPTFEKDVLAAVQANKPENCPKPLGYEWINEVCWQRIAYRENSRKFCSKYKDNNYRYTTCIGLLAKANNDRSLCNEFKREKSEKSRRAHSYCYSVFGFYFTGNIQNLLDIKKATKLKGYSSVHPKMLLKKLDNWNSPFSENPGTDN